MQQDLRVSPFETHSPSVVPKWNTSCQIFGDIEDMRRRGSQAHQLRSEFL